MHISIVSVAAKYGDQLSEEDYDCFDDVGVQWFAPYVCLAKAKGIISGYDDGTFRPGQEINFAEAAKILNEVYGLKGKKMKGGKWYADYVKQLQKKKFIPPTIKKLGKKLSRAEMAELIWRVMENRQDQESEDLIEFEDEVIVNDEPEDESEDEPEEESEEESEDEPEEESEEESEEEDGSDENDSEDEL